MMYRIQRFVMDDGQRAGGKGADEEGADKARGVSDGNGVDIVPGAVGVGEGLVDHRIDDFDVAASRDLWYNTTILSVNIDLCLDNVREEPSAVFDNRGCCFVATAFDTKYFHYC